MKTVAQDNPFKVVFQLKEKGSWIPPKGGRDGYWEQTFSRVVIHFDGLHYVMTSKGQTKREAINAAIDRAVQWLEEHRY